jgi:hypothetical protein
MICGGEVESSKFKVQGSRFKVQSSKLKADLIEHQEKRIFQCLTDGKGP